MCAHWNETCEYLLLPPFVFNWCWTFRHRLKKVASNIQYFTHSCGPDMPRGSPTYIQCENWAAPAQLPQFFSPQTTVDPTSYPCPATPAASCGEVLPSALPAFFFRSLSPRCTSCPSSRCRNSARPLQPGDRRRAEAAAARCQRGQSYIISRLFPLTFPFRS
jgi:hypothetical protein